MNPHNLHKLTRTKMTQLHPFKTFTAILVMAFVLRAAVATAQVTITYGNPTNSNPNYRVQGYPVYSAPQNNGYSYVPSPVVRYQQSPQQFSTQGGHFRSGYRGNYTTRSQAYRPSYTSPYKPDRPSQPPVYYGNQTDGNGYYYDGYNGYEGYNGTQSQQRGAAFGGSIGRALGGQRSGNIGAAIGAAVGSP